MVLLNSPYCKIILNEPLRQANWWANIPSISFSIVALDITALNLLSDISSTSIAPILSAYELRCVRGERCLFDGIGFSLSAGQCLHLLGSNGSGKTSLLRIIAGINRPQSGDVQWRASSIFDDTANRQKYFSAVAYLGHKDGLKDELTATENLSFYRRLENASNQTLIDQDLARMGILEHAEISANKLSFGQRRRLAFARLLHADFRLWILDEPFTGVDIQGRTLIEQICNQHLASGGIIILTNHQSLATSLFAQHIKQLRL